VTEAEWLQCTYPDSMVKFLRGTSTGQPLGAGAHAVEDYPNSKISPRKLRLFVCGCCRPVWQQLKDPSSRAAVETAERYVDGQDSEEELRAAHAAADAVCRCSSIALPQFVWSSLASVFGAASGGIRIPVRPHLSPAPSPPPSIPAHSAPVRVGGRAARRRCSRRPPGRTERRVRSTLLTSPPPPSNPARSKAQRGSG
jgi:hypothetical protein